MAKIQIPNFAEAIASLRGAMSSATRDYNAAVVALAELKREREEIANAPTARVDLIAVLTARIDREKDEYRVALDSCLKQYADYGPEYLAKQLDPHAQRSSNHFFFRLTSRPRDDYPADHLEEKRALSAGAFLFFADPELVDHVKSTMIERINALDIPGEGLPLVERRARLAELDAQIQAAERGLKEARETMQAAGLAPPPASQGTGPVVSTGTMIS